MLLLSLSIAEFNVGYCGKAIALMKQCIDVDAYNSAKKHRKLAFYYFAAGNLKAGEETTKIGIDICNEKISNPRLSDYLAEVYKRERALLLSKLLEAKGKYKKAEPYRRIAVKIFDKQFKTKNRKGYFTFKRKLAMNLAAQGRFVEAEIELREVLTEAIGLTGKTSIETARIWMNYPPPVELHDYRYLGDDFRERERITKITKNWVARLKKKPVLERNALLSAMNSLNEMD